MILSVGLALGVELEITSTQNVLSLVLIETAIMPTGKFGWINRE